LIALHNAYLGSDSRGYLLKAELILLAQPLCDSSFVTVRKRFYFFVFPSFFNVIFLFVVLFVSFLLSLVVVVVSCCVVLVV